MKSNERKTEWFREKEYGFFFHFLNSGPIGAENRNQWTPIPPAEWNRYVESFDTGRLAKQLHELRAGFAWLTVGQNSGYYCCPNAAYDRLSGYAADSHCSKRDLISDFADALAEYEIPLFVYSTCMAPGGDTNVLRKLKCEQAWPQKEQGKICTPEFERMSGFLTMWIEIHREWAERWGRKIHGWWIDGTYNPEWLFLFADEPNGKSFANALRAGNPDALLAFNPGVLYSPRRNYPGSPEDMTAGEIFDPHLGILPSAQTPDGLQYFLLTFAGVCWSRAPLRYTSGEFTEITRNVTDNGGVIAWDLPFTENGIQEDSFRILHAYTEEYRHSRSVFPKTAVQVQPPVLHEDGSSEPGLLTLKPQQPAEITVFWNGEPLNAPFRLPYSGQKKQKIEVACCGYRRGFPVYADWRLRLGAEFSGAFPITGDDGSRIGEYSFARSGEIFRIHAEVKEKEPLICEVPWFNSCLELFLATPDRFTRRQFCIQHDGRVMEHLSGRLLPADFIRAILFRQDILLAIDLEITLPAAYRDGAFRFEIQQSVNRAGKAVHGVLFGPNVEASSNYALVEPEITERCDSPQTDRG